MKHKPLDREAALIGYGALRASNFDGRLDVVLTEMAEMLWPVRVECAIEIPVLKVGESRE